MLTWSIKFPLKLSSNYAFSSLSNPPQIKIKTGEWAISTAFNTTDDFLRGWGDAQKLAFSQGAGWIFWNFKVDPDARVPQQKMWSYLDAVDSGVMTKKPDQYFNKDVCAPYV